MEQLLRPFNGEPITAGSAEGSPPIPVLIDSGGEHKEKAHRPGHLSVKRPLPS
jgi:hypothetical protein